MSLLTCPVSVAAGTHEIGASVTGSLSAGVVIRTRIKNSSWYMVCGSNSSVTASATAGGSTLVTCNNAKGGVVKIGNEWFPSTLMVKFENTSTAVAKVSVYVYTADGLTTLGYGTDISVPATSVCSATLSDIDLGSLIRGESSSTELPITTSGNGQSAITFTGTHLDSSGVLHLGGSTSGVTLTPDDKDFINGNSWAASRTVPLTLQVGSAASVGELTSVLSATLSCK